MACTCGRAMPSRRRQGKKPFGLWRPTKSKRVRSGMPKACFLDPKNLKYVVCKGTGKRAKPSCEGVLAARRRAILQRARKMRAKAERLARELGCRWALK